MARITSFGQIDSLSVNATVLVPLVILKEQKNNVTKFRGFIPALTKKDIVSNTLESCKQQIKQTANLIINNMAKNNLPFPFFPTKQQLKTDYPNLCEIIYIKISSQKRKANTTT